jgi:hypothetical protein
MSDRLADYFPLSASVIYWRMLECCVFHQNFFDVRVLRVSSIILFSFIVPVAWNQVMEFH